MNDKVIRLNCGAYRKWVWVWSTGQYIMVLWKEHVGVMAGPRRQLP